MNGEGIADQGMKRVSSGGFWIFGTINTISRIVVENPYLARRGGFVGNRPIVTGRTFRKAGKGIPRRRTRGREINPDEIPF